MRRDRNALGQALEVKIDCHVKTLPVGRLPQLFSQILRLWLKQKLCATVDLQKRTAPRRCRIALDRARVVWVTWWIREF